MFVAVPITALSVSQSWARLIQSREYVTGRSNDLLRKQTWRRGQWLSPFLNWYPNVIDPINIQIILIDLIIMQIRLDYLYCQVAWGLRIENKHGGRKHRLFILFSHLQTM
jgi:hypothetical protein